MPHLGRPIPGIGPVTATALDFFCLRDFDQRQQSISLDQLAAISDVADSA
jgi:hypothetical protein